MTAATSTDTTWGVGSIALVLLALLLGAAGEAALDEAVDELDEAVNGFNRELDDFN